MSGWIVASLSASGWRFMWIRPRRAMTQVSWITPRDGSGACWRRRRVPGWPAGVGGGGGGHRSVSSVGSSSGGEPGQGQEHLVEAGLVQAQVVERDVAPRPARWPRRAACRRRCSRARSGSGLSTSMRGSAPVTAAIDAGGIVEGPASHDHDVEVVAADLSLQLAGVAPGDDAAVVDDDDVVGEALGLVQVLRGQQQRRAPLDEVSRAPPTARCGRGGRGRSSARRGRGPRGRTPAWRPGRGAGACRRSSPRSPGRRRRPARTPRAAARPASFAARRPNWWSSPSITRFSRPVSSGSTVASCAARPMRRRTSPGSWATSKPATDGLALVGLGQGGEDADGRGLAGAVGPSTAVTVPVGHLEVDPGQGRRRPVALHQPPGTYGKAGRSF